MTLPNKKRHQRIKMQTQRRRSAPPEPPVAVRVEILALARQGWTNTELAARFNLNVHYIAKLTAGVRTRG